MIDLSDVTFTIPVKIDHEDREKNLKVVVDYLVKHFNTSIMICEQDTEKVPEILDGYKFDYIKVNREDGLIHRTRQLNVMAKQATTPYIANYDADVIFSVPQYVKTMELLRKDKADGVFPYAGRFEDVEKSVHVLFRNSLDIEVIKEHHLHLNHPNSLGGAIFWNRKKFLEGGGENENFISWGWEDNERFNRFTKLGYRIKRVDGILYHLNHHRGHNSSPKNPEHTKNQHRYNKIMSLNKEQLLKEIKTWSWVK